MSRAIPLPVMAAEAPRVECTACAKCCTYVAVGVEAPDTTKDAGYLLWYLYHPGVSVYHDGCGDWSVIFESRCRNLRDDKLCGIYETRPALCREFDNATCDVNDPGEGLEFFRPEEFLAWLALEKPRIHRRLSNGFVPESLKPPAEVRVPARLRPRR